ncbi:cytochrome P450 4d2 [Amyelois transitella]|uniref:cytochrome P450 4d2 n=1 Tax=Amyelois transitella TaxID=680683 RepID=UPI00067CC4E1|nr:cytochrome P450 4d2 [Amyelois transitella]
MTPLSLILFCVFVCLVLWLWCNRRFISVYRKVGSKHITKSEWYSFLFRSDREEVLKSLHSISDHAITNGGLSAIWMLHRFYLIIAGAEDAEYVLKYHLEKDDLMWALRFYTRTSSVFATVPIWRPRRKIISALLSHRNVTKFEPVFAKNSKILTEQLQPHVGKDAFSIWEHLNALTLDITCITILGIDLNSQMNLQDPLRTAVTGVMDLAGEILMQFWYHVEFIMKRTKNYRKFLKYDQVINDYVNVAMKKHAQITKDDSKTLSIDNEEGEAFSLLHLLTELKEQRGFDHTMIHDESLGLLLAASETTAVSSSMVCVLLSRVPHVQHKVYQELMEVFGESDRDVTNEDLPRLRYLEAVIKETQRLYPPGPYITRKALEDFVLPSGVEVPKGTNFLISIYALNRNPKYWGPDADEFRPERFLDGSFSEKTIHFAFSNGPRGCPGTVFAMMVMKTVLATLLRQYRLLPAAPGAPLRFQLGLTSKAVDKFSVKIQLRVDRKSV